MIKVIVFCLWISSINAGNIILQKWKRNLLQSPVNYHINAEDLPKAQWFEQTLDHFHPTDNRTWNQRLGLYRAELSSRAFDF